MDALPNTLISSEAAPETFEIPLRFCGKTLEGYK
jgi:hypothetical protein